MDDQIYAERAEAELSDLKHDIARAAQTASELATELARYRNAIKKAVEHHEAEGRAFRVCAGLSMTPTEREQHEKRADYHATRAAELRKLLPEGE
jgi:hypothetical protein